MNSLKCHLLLCAALSAGAAGAQDIVIGQVVPLTGVQAATGTAARDGAQLYVDKVNRQGGIQGRKLVLDVRDDEYQPAKTVSLTRALIAEKSPVVLISTIGAASVEALVKEKVLEDGKVGLLGPTSGSGSMYSSAHVYPVRASYARETLKFLEQFKGTGVKRLALVYQDDAFGKEGLAIVQQYLKTAPEMQLVAAVPYGRTDPDLSKQAQEVGKTNPRAVLLYAVTKPAGSFIKHFKPFSTTATVAMVSAVDPESLVSQIGTDAQGSLIGLFLPHPEGRKELLVREMNQDSKDLGRPLSNSPRFQLGYVTARVAVAAMRSIKGPVTAESMSAALDATRVFKLTDTLEVRNTGKDRGLNFIDIGIIGRSGILY